MAKSAEKTSGSKEGLPEKGSRFLRNFNMAVGGIALAGAVIAPPLIAVPLAAYGVFNVAQAGGFEGLRRLAKRRRERKNS